MKLPNVIAVVLATAAGTGAWVREHYEVREYIDERLNSTGAHPADAPNDSPLSVLGERPEQTYVIRAPAALPLAPAQAPARAKATIKLVIEPGRHSLEATTDGDVDLDIDVQDRRPVGPATRVRKVPRDASSAEPTQHLWSSKLMFGPRDLGCAAPSAADRPDGWSEPFASVLCANRHVIGRCVAPIVARLTRPITGEIQYPFERGSIGGNIQPLLVGTVPRGSARDLVSCLQQTAGEFLPPLPASGYGVVHVPIELRGGS